MKQSAEDLSKSLKHQHEEILKQHTLQKNPLDIDNWEEDLTKWPKTHTGQLFIHNYTLEMKAFST